MSLCALRIASGDGGWPAPEGEWTAVIDAITAAKAQATVFLIAPALAVLWPLRPQFPLAIRYLSGSKLGTTQFLLARLEQVYIAYLNLGHGLVDDELVDRFLECATRRTVSPCLKEISGVLRRKAITVPKKDLVSSGPQILTLQLRQDVRIDNLSVTLGKDSFVDSSIYLS
jgi:hypothetical protein